MRPIYGVRFLHAVPMPAKTFGRVMLCTELHAHEGFAFEATPIGLEVIADGHDLTVPWANVRCLDHVERRPEGE